MWKVLILLCLKSLPVSYVGISQIVHHVIFKILADQSWKQKHIFTTKEKRVNSLCLLVVWVFKLDLNKNVQVVKTVTENSQKHFLGIYLHLSWPLWWARRRCGSPPPADESTRTDPWPSPPGTHGSPRLAWCQNAGRTRGRNPGGENFSPGRSGPAWQERRERREREDVNVCRQRKWLGAHVYALRSRN